MSENTPISLRIKRQDLKSFLAFFIHPGRIFDQIAAEGRPGWLLPMLGLSVGLLLRVILAGYLRTRASALGGLTLPPEWEWWSPEMQNNYMLGIQTTQGPAFVYLIPSITGLIGLWLGWPILSSMLHLLSTLLGGRSSQSPTLNVVAWSSLPFAVRDIFRCVYMLLAGNEIARYGLSGFAGDGQAAGFLSSLLQHADLFLVWHVLLMVAGLARIDGLTKAKTWLAVGGVVLVSLLGLAGLGAVLASLGSSAISRPFFF